MKASGMNGSIRYQRRTTIRFDILRSLATVEECYRAGMEEEERLRRLATDTWYLVTRSKTHCHKQRPRIDFSAQARGKK